MFSNSALVFCLDRLNLRDVFQRVINGLNAAPFTQHQYIVRSPVLPMRPSRLWKYNLDINYPELRLISMFRSLLDHSEFSISREFGKDSDQLKKWKDIQSKYYDEFFEYRLFYKLRNYCQHIGMPPLSISFTSTREEEGICFRLDIKREELLKERSIWNNKLIHDLNSCSDKISVIDSLNTWSECFRGLAKALLDIKHDVAIDAANRIAGHRARLELPINVGRLCAVHIPYTTEKPKTLNMSLNWLPEKKALEILEGNPFDKKSEEA